MTNWVPDISRSEKPKYRALADAIAEAIDTGELPVGTRLPTHRDLAWKLGVTVGTVTRAYALAQAEGRIAGEVGRGTYVLPPDSTPAVPAGSRLAFPMTAFDRPAAATDRPTGPIIMNQNFPADPWVNEMLAEAMRRLAVPERLHAIDGYLPPSGLKRHREAGLAWLRRFGIERDEESVLITGGCQHGLCVAFLALTSPGDTILTESLTWPGARQMAEMLGLKIAPVDIDDHGLLPEAFEAVCRRTEVRLLYTVPTLHNPTASVLPAERRQAIARIAQRHGVHIVEDDVFGYVAQDAPPPICHFAPDLGIYVTSLSKPVAPILRAGFISAPLSLVPKLSAAIRATALMPSPINAEIASNLILSGAAETAAGRQRETAAARQAMADDLLGGATRLAHPSGTHIWLKLPAPWTGESFVAQALAGGVAVTPGSAFAINGHGDAVNAVRLCLNAETDPARIRKGLEVIAELLRSAPPAAEPIV